MELASHNVDKSHCLNINKYFCCTLLPTHSLLSVLDYLRLSQLKTQFDRPVNLSFKTEVGMLNGRTVVGCANILQACIGCPFLFKTKVDDSGWSDSRRVD